MNARQLRDDRLLLGAGLLEIDLRNLSELLADRDFLAVLDDRNRSTEGRVGVGTFAKLVLFRWTRV